jgi:hypothetical protein
MEKTSDRIVAIWLGRCGWAAAGSMFTLLVWTLVGYYVGSNKKLHPGIDFPVAWPGKEQLGDAYDSFAVIEESKQQSDLNRMKFSYRTWCEVNGLMPRDMTQH